MKFLTTSWCVDTQQGHELEVLHCDIPVTDATSAANAERAVRGMRLTPDGMLTYLRKGVSPIIVPPEDVVVRVYNRPTDLRGAAFIPDTSTEAGRARVAATLSDPAYVVRPGEMEIISLPLSELAALPGAAGRLESLAYGT